jgi:hypothetical protein
MEVQGLNNLNKTIFNNFWELEVIGFIKTKQIAREKNEDHLKIKKKT